MGVGTVLIVGGAVTIAGIADMTILRKRDDLKNLLHVLVKIALIGIVGWMFWDLSWGVINSMGGLPRI